eukprot:13993063-Alexandrium_andersonii.AAC.1
MSRAGPHTGGFAPKKWRGTGGVAPPVAAAGGRAALRPGHDRMRRRGARRKTRAALGPFNKHWRSGA